MRVPRTVVLCLSLAGVASVRSAQAETRTDEVVTVDYAAPSGCPTRSEFMTRVRRRTPKGRAYRADTKSSMRVVIEQTDGGHLATLEVVEAGGAKTKREVHGQTCREVTEAIALVVALALTEPAPSSEPGPEGTSTAAVAAFPVPEGASPGAAPPSSPAVEPKQPADTGEIPGATPHDEPIPFALGFSATASGGVAPVPAWGGFVFLEAFGLQSPNARIGVGARASTSVSRDPGTARFEWYGARLDGCIPILTFGDAGALSGCAVFESGVLYGHGRSIDVPRDALDPWAALGALLRPRLAIGSVTLEAEGGVIAPLTRPKYVFGDPGDPEAVVHRVPTVTWTAGIGAALSLR